MNSIKNKGYNVFEVDFEKFIDSDSKSLSFLMDKDRDIYYEEFLNEEQAFSWRINRGRKDLVNPYQHINETTYKELLNMADKKRKLRASKMKTKYMGVTNSRGWITFSTESQRIKGKYYTQHIKLAEADSIKYFKEFNPREITRLFLSGDIQVSCSCPDMRYRYRYMAYNLGYGIQKEMRFPKIRNSRLEGSVCKHLIVVLRVIQMNWAGIARDLQRSKFFKKKMDDKDYFDTLEKIRSKKRNRK